MLVLMVMTIGSASSLEMYTLHGGSGTGTGKSLAVVEVDIDSGNVGDLLSTSVLEDPGGSLHGLACGFEDNKFITVEHDGDRSRLVSILESRKDWGETNLVNLAQDIGNEDVITVRHYHAAALDLRTATLFASVLILEILLEHFEHGMLIARHMGLLVRMTLV